jgi:3-dehydroquinate synthetase
MVDIKIIRCSVQDVAGKLAAYGSIFIVYDRNVRSVVRALGVPAAASLEIEATERNKVLSTVEDICRWLMRHDAGRDAFLLGV